MWHKECLVRLFFLNNAIGHELARAKREESESSYLDTDVDTIVKEMIEYVNNDGASDDTIQQAIESFWEAKDVNFYSLSGIKKKKYHEAESKATKELRDMTSVMLSKQVKEVLTFDSLYERAAEDEGDWRYDVDVERYAQEILRESNIDMYEMRGELNKHIREVVKAVKDKMKTERKKEYDTRLAVEKEKLPDIVDDAVQWARKAGLTRFTRADTSSYLAEKPLDLLPDIENLFYAKVNHKLRKK